MSIPPKNNPNKLVTTVAFVIALSIMGDSLMYSLLPLEAENLGIPLTLVGLLLSANRIIRFISNTWAGLAYERWGARWPFLLAALVGCAAAVVYSLPVGFVAFLLARVAWGIAWSTFRQGSYQAVWAAAAEQKGRLLGLNWGLIRLGSVVSVLLGGFLYDRYGYQTAATVIAAITFFAIPGAAAIRWPKNTADPTTTATNTPLNGWRLAWHTAPHRWGLVNGFMIALFEGILTSTISLFLVDRLPAEFGLAGIGTLAGVLLAMRFASNILFAPTIGALSDRIGQAPAMVAMAAIMMGGLIGTVSLAGVGALLCLAFVFIAGAGFFAAVNAAASGLATQTERPHRYISAFTTAIDAGSAAGPLLAYSSGQLTGLGALYLLGMGLLLLAALRFWRLQSA